MAGDELGLLGHLQKAQMDVAEVKSGQYRLSDVYPSSPETVGRS